MSSTESVASSDGSSSSDEGNRELQLALKAGLLNKNGLNIQRERKRPVINKVKEMELRLFQVTKKRNWIDSLDVTFPSSATYSGTVSDDFDREACFVKQATSSVELALPRLHSLNVPIFRPSDYYAEMAKSDDHMRKVRERLLGAQKAKDGREAAVRQREERRFAVEVQKNQEARKHREKRKLMLAVKKHRKGMKDQLDAILNNKSRDQAEDEQDFPHTGMKGRGKRSKKISRSARDKKYGFGGPKRRSKKNDKKSFEGVFAKSRGKMGAKSGKGKGRGKR